MALLFLGGVGKREGEKQGGRGHLCIFRQRKEGQKTLPASVDSELSSTQNNLYAQVASFRTTYSDSLPWFSKTVLSING